MIEFRVGRGTCANAQTPISVAVSLTIRRRWQVGTLASPIYFGSHSMQALLRSHNINPKLVTTHRFKLGQILEAYETFGRAAG